MRNKTDNLLYKKVLGILLDDLAKGVLKIGNRLPTEVDYAAQVGVSRSTVRLAFDQLEQAGIIKRRKRGGTEIISTKASQRYTMSAEGANHNVLNVILDSLFDITDVRSVSTEDFSVLKEFEAAGDSWLLCEGTRSRPDEDYPFNWSQVFVCHQYAEIEVKVGDSPRSIHELIEQHYDCLLGRVKKHYSADVCSVAMALTLGLKEGDSITTGLAELYNVDGGLVALVKSTYDPARFTFVTDVFETDNALS